MWESIRRRQPERLYVAADGPRRHRPDDQGNCQRVRDIVSDVDWPCEVKYLFAEDNKGCAVAVSSAITWFFDHEEMGIILEDDCLPDDSFYCFCSELLERYRTDSRIMAICGNNFQYRGGVAVKESYYFGKNGHIWGWATWRRAWRHYDRLTALWPEVREANADLVFYDSNAEKNARRRDFDYLHKHPEHTWDTPWVLCCWLQNGLWIVPSKNLVKNIGFGGAQTRTVTEPLIVRLTPVESMDRMIHPKYVVRNVQADKVDFARWHRSPFAEAVYRRLPQGMRAVVVTCYNSVCQMIVAVLRGFRK